MISFLPSNRAQNTERELMLMLTSILGSYYYLRPTKCDCQMVTVIVDCSALALQIVELKAKTFRHFYQRIRRKRSGIKKMGCV